MNKSQIGISSATARQKVNVLMLERVNHLLLGGEPILVLNDAGQRIWRVPVDFTFGQRGRVGQVGEIDVDASDGQVFLDDDLIARIACNTAEIAHRENDALVHLAAP